MNDGKVDAAPVRGSLTAGVLTLALGLTAIVAVTAATSLPPWVVPVMLMTVFAAAGGASMLMHDRVRAETAAAVASSPEAPAFTLEPVRFRVDVRGGYEIVDARDVEWFEAHRNYARLYTGDGSYLYRASLAELERGLDPATFVRVHRSALVNIAAITRVEPIRAGDAWLFLRSGGRIRLSRRYGRAFRERVGEG